MKSLALVLSSLALLTLVPAAGRAAPPPDIEGNCSGLVRVHYNPDGSIHRMRLHCGGDCTTDGRCHQDGVGSPQAGGSDWCDCDRDGAEPTGCHVVLVSPPDHGDPQISCSGSCLDPLAECLPVIVDSQPTNNGGMYEDISCACF